MTITIDIEPFEEETIDIDELKKKLKDRIPEQMNNNIKKHNEIIGIINKHEKSIVQQTPHQLSVLEFYYNKAEREAHKLAGYFKAQYQYYNGRAATERGKFYIYDRETNGYNVNDSNYRSKEREGLNQEISGVYEGYFTTWKGIANSYAGMQTTLRHMRKAIDDET